MITDNRNTGLTHKRLLSIDLDYLSSTMKINGDKIEKDENKFRFVRKLIDKYKDKIIFLINHGDIVEELDKREKCTLYNWEIVNIDHHHDIYYSENERREIMRESYLHHCKVPERSLESDWLFWIGQNWSLSRVDEILNEDSVVHRRVLSYGARFHFEFGSPLDPYGIDIFEKYFDYVCVALSPHYVTPDDREYICEYLGLNLADFKEDHKIEISKEGEEVDDRLQQK